MIISSSYILVSPMLHVCGVKEKETLTDLSLG